MKKECEFGVIEYRKPNMLEGLEFLGKMGLNSSNLQDQSYLMNNDLYYTAQAIKHMEPFVEKVDMKLKKKSIKSYKEMTDYIEFMPILMEISAELMSFIQVDDKKKP